MYSSFGSFWPSPFVTVASRDRVAVSLFLDLPFVSSFPLQQPASFPPFLANIFLLARDMGKKI